ncbi:MAG: pyruvate kinase [Myxococcota bacterium]
MNPLSKWTKIVCTLGPASQGDGVLDALIARGMNVARLNFSHGTHEDHRATFSRVRAAAERAGVEVAILQDLQGPKIRMGRLREGGVRVDADDTVVIVHGDAQTDERLVTSYDAFARDVSVGDTVLVDDGLIRMRVVDVRGDEVRCAVEVGGTVKDRKGINLPGVAVSAPSLTEKDLADLAFGVTLGVDFVGLSFVRGPQDISLAREALRSHGAATPIIAKIEKPEAVRQLDAILDVVDGIMVARGDLGVELGPEKVPLIQKEAIESANRRGKLVITATQMLESMVESATPTRAEASDVANAVLDQSDAVMLSGETATGRHPALVVDTMRRIICEVEDSPRYRQALHALSPLEIPNTSNAIAHAAAAAARSLPDITAICTISIHGIAPTLMSDYRPPVPIIALTMDRSACHRLAAYWGVAPFQFDIEDHEGTESTIARAEALLLDRDLVARGDKIVMTLAVPAGAGGHTNTLKVHRVGALASVMAPPPAGGPGGDDRTDGVYTLDHNR